MIGGYPTGRIPSNVVQVHDATTDSWQYGPPVPAPMHHAMAAVVDGTLYLLGCEFDGKIYVAGGAVSRGGNTGSTHHQVYRPELSCG